MSPASDASALPPSLWQRCHGSLILRLLGTGLLVCLLLSQRDLVDQLQVRLGALRQHSAWIAAGIGSAGLTVLLMVCRWRLLLKPLLADLPFHRVLRVELISYFFNLSSLGAAGGDAYKIIALGSQYPTRKAAVGFSIMIDHMLGFAGMVLLSLLSAPTLLDQWQHGGATVQLMVRGYLVFVSGTLVFFVLSIILASPPALVFLRRHFRRLAGRRIVPALEAAFDFMSRNLPTLLKATLVSMLMTTSFFFTFYCGVRAVGAQVPVVDVLMAMPLVDIAASLPVSISGLGVREHTFETLLAAFSGLDRADGLSGAFVGWLFSVVWALVGGLLFAIGKPGKAAESQVSS